MQDLTGLAPVLAIIGLIVAGFIYFGMVRMPAGSDRMKEIADSIHLGAMVFLKREYSIVLIFVTIVFIILALVMPTVLTKRKLALK